MAREFKKVQLLVFQGTPFCNIDCSYCYLADRTSNSKIDLETIEKTCIGLLETSMLADHVTILWHAGEPLVMGREFYEQAFTLIRDVLKGKAISFAVQTNGLLLNIEWISFFEKWDVQLGLSWDGPPEINDLQRITRSGRGTSERIERAAELIRNSSLALNVICVLTKHSMSRPERLFNYFELQRVNSISFNLEEIEGSNDTSTIFDARLRREDFRTFLEAYFSFCICADSKQDVREFVTGMSFFLSEDHIGSNLEVDPGRILTVGVDGSVSTFSPELHGSELPTGERFLLSNVLTDPSWARSMQASSVLSRVDQEIVSGIERCQQTCSYFEVCLGGSPSNKLGEHKRFDIAETVSCNFYIKAVSDATLSIIREHSKEELHSRICDRSQFGYSP